MRPSAPETSRRPSTQNGAIATRRVLVVLTLFLSAGAAQAHGEEDHLDDQLIDSGERLLVGSFTAPQPGPLVVVPYVDRPLGCGDVAEAAYRIRLGDDAGVAFVTNETLLQAIYDMPPGHHGYLGFAVDTHDATRALLLMQENAIALHALIGVVNANGSAVEARTGVLGLPYSLGEGEAHDMTGVVIEGGGVVMAHDGSFGGADWCEREDGHFALSFQRARLPDSLGPGQLVHAVVLGESTLARFLPRPLDETTRVLQANLYLTRAGEDPARIRAALDPTPGFAQFAPLAFVIAGTTVALWRPRP